jgi:hypothetical protein
MDNEKMLTEVEAIFNQLEEKINDISDNMIQEAIMQMNYADYTVTFIKSPTKNIEVYGKENSSIKNEIKDIFSTVLNGRVNELKTYYLKLEATYNLVKDLVTLGKYKEITTKYQRLIGIFHVKRNELSKLQQQFEQQQSPL